MGNETGGAVLSGSVSFHATPLQSSPIGWLPWTSETKVLVFLVSSVVFSWLEVAPSHAIPHATWFSKWVSSFGEWKVF